MSERDVRAYAFVNFRPSTKHSDDGEKTSVVTPRQMAQRITGVAGSITPTFASFVTFVKTEAGIATDPVFSREALSRLNVTEGPDRFDKGGNANKPRTYGYRSRTTSHVSSHATTVLAAPKNERCGPENLCKTCGKSHDLDVCKEYLKTSLQERREFLKEKELCFACYGGGHRSNRYAQRKICKTCNRRHPTGLQDDNFHPNLPTIRNQNLSNEQPVDVVTTSRALGSFR